MPARNGITPCAQPLQHFRARDLLQPFENRPSCPVGNELCTVQHMKSRSDERMLAERDYEPFGLQIFLHENMRPDGHPETAARGLQGQEEMIEVGS